MKSAVEMQQVDVAGGATCHSGSEFPQGYLSSKCVGPRLRVGFKDATVLLEENEIGTDSQTPPCSFLDTGGGTILANDRERRRARI